MPLSLFGDATWLLNGQGRLARPYGGAMALGANPEASLRHRTGEAFEQKHSIARWAAP